MCIYIYNVCVCVYIYIYMECSNVHSIKMINKLNGKEDDLRLATMKSGFKKMSSKPTPHIQLPPAGMVGPDRVGASQIFSAFGDRGSPKMAMESSLGHESWHQNWSCAISPYFQANCGGLRFGVSDNSWTSDTYGLICCIGIGWSTLWTKKSSSWSLHN